MARRASPIKFEPGCASSRALPTYFTDTRLDLTPLNFLP